MTRSQSGRSMQEGEVWLEGSPGSLQPTGLSLQQSGSKEEGQSEQEALKEVVNQPLSFLLLIAIQWLEVGSLCRCMLIAGDDYCSELERAFADIMSLKLA
ncbi:hypothetical protein NDU88_001771 [Pleurodeles waltl]|uniref:Uncharacterized protein n=1 Tax=Pleurodeles waltl TaxID=8319 RepID=A0AAV7Q4N0_PLEWA|nr:hypothetical protein NDU88_001771 [Pleurodeles waltl]